VHKQYAFVELPEILTRLVRGALDLAGNSGSEKKST
jgi:hypothetical protein